MTLSIDEPPEFGEINLRLSMAPASMQTSKAARQVVCDRVREITRALKYLLDGYVYIDLEWHIHERFRWESDASADVDNIIKPLLDALSGPDGILIDDSQIKSLSSSWFSSLSDEQRVDIRIRFESLEFLMKEDLVFVRVKDALCYPVPGEVRKKGAVQIWIDFLMSDVESRSKIATITQSYYPARYVLPHGFFHRTRLRSFRVLSISDLLKEDNADT